MLSIKSLYNYMKADLTPNKEMVTTFWDARGITNIDYLQIGKTITGEFKVNWFNRLNDDRKKKCVLSTKQFKGANVSSCYGVI